MKDEASLKSAPISDSGQKDKLLCKLPHVSSICSCCKQCEAESTTDRHPICEDLDHPGKFARMIKV